MPAPQFKYFLLTIPHADFLPFLPPSITYIRGQLEQGANTGYLHWQILAVAHKKRTVTSVRQLFGESCHVEPSRSEAANDYVWKEDTRVEGTQFEIGKMPFKRNNQADWDTVVQDAKRGRLDNIPSDILVRHYNNLRRIASDYQEPAAIEREVVCYWGTTGAGKSRRAWEEAGLDAYPKDPRTKFWDGYRGQENVVVDEFRGGIDIAHLLRWLDRYPVIVELKGASTVLKAKKLWFTSNLHPESWYPTLDNETRQALFRRMEITHFQ